MITRFALTAAAATIAVGPAMAQETYKIGLSGALTGPSAGSYAPAVEGLRLYIDALNANGGIDGRNVQLIVLDDSGEASRGAVNARRLLNQEEVSLLINASLSSTYSPMISDASRADVPLLFASSACPREVYPPAEANLFCSTAFAAQYDSEATLSLIEEISGTDVDLGLVAMEIPLSRGEIDQAEIMARERGMNPVAKTTLPPVTGDFTPYATSLQQAGAEWVYSWAPWVTQVRTFEALRRLGWQGNYAGWAHLEAEGELVRLSDEGFFAVGANSLFSEDLPVHQEIIAAAEEANSSYPAYQMAEGWIAGLVVEEALRSAGWPADGATIREAMNTLTVDTQGLRGGAIEWTPENHFRTTQYYRVYRWDDATGEIEIVRDWFSYEIE